MWGFGLGMAGFQARGGRLPHGSKQIDGCEVHALSRGDEAADAARLSRQQRKKAVPAGAADAEAEQPDTSGARVLQDRLGPEYLAIRDDEDIAFLAQGSRCCLNTGREFGPSACIQLIQKSAGALAVLPSGWKERGVHRLDMIVKTQQQEGIFFGHCGQASFDGSSGL
jgi:hypothetical protein